MRWPSSCDRPAPLTSRPWPGTSGTRPTWTDLVARTRRTLRDARTCWCSTPGSARPVALADFHPRRFDKQVTAEPAGAVRAAAAGPAAPAQGRGGEPDSRREGDRAQLDHRACTPNPTWRSTERRRQLSCRSSGRSTARRSSGGVCATAISPAYVDTDMAAYVHERIPAETMIEVADVVEMVDACLRLSARATVPEIVMARSSSDGHGA